MEQKPSYADIVKRSVHLQKLSTSSSPRKRKLSQLSPIPPCEPWNGLCHCPTEGICWFGMSSLFTNMHLTMFSDGRYCVKLDNST